MIPLLAYPLRCQELFKDYLWGGRRLQTSLGKPIPEFGVWAESWEFIDHPEHSSRVSNGYFAGKTLGQITESHRQWLLGEGFDKLPLLLKYLDCQKVLSVQVHPDDTYAQKMSPPDWGKTEAWYILDSQPGSVLYAGLKPGVTRQDLAQAVKQGTTDECLHRIHPSAGDCIFIPAGTVHALGAGLLVAEIQQASNATFRLFDWNRVGADGKPRDLHVQQSLEVSDYHSGPRQLQKPVGTKQLGRERLVSSDKFTLDRIQFVDSAEVAGDGRFHLVTSPTGGVLLEGEGFSESIDVGQSLLIPAAMKACTARLQKHALLLDMFVGEG